MGSKVIGVRVSDDLAESLEKLAAEKGQKASQYLKDLIDDILYPSKTVKLDEVADSQMAKEDFEILQDRIADLDSDVHETLRELTGEVSKVSGEQSKLDSSLSAHRDTENMKYEDFTNKIRYLETKLNSLLQAFSSLDICPKCGKQLHRHTVDDEHWHLECAYCGAYSNTYKPPKWADNPGISLKAKENQGVVYKVK